MTATKLGYYSSVLGKLNHLKLGIESSGRSGVRGRKYCCLKLWNSCPHVQHNLDFYLGMRIALWEKGEGQIVFNINIYLDCTSLLLKPFPFLSH